MVKERGKTLFRVAGYDVFQVITVASVLRCQKQTNYSELL